MILCKGFGNFLEHRTNLIGLGGENQNAGRFRHGAVAVGNLSSDFIGKMFAGSLNWVGGDDFTWKNQLGVYETSRQGGGHFARAEKTDFELGCHEAFFNRCRTLEKVKTPPISRFVRVDSGHGDVAPTVQSFVWIIQSQLEFIMLLVNLPMFFKDVWKPQILGYF